MNSRPKYFLALGLGILGVMAVVAVIVYLFKMNSTGVLVSVVACWFFFHSAGRITSAPAGLIERSPERPSRVKR